MLETQNPHPSEGAHTMTDTLTLTGYLGNDPKIRETSGRRRLQPGGPSRLRFGHGGVRITDALGIRQGQPAETAPPRTAKAVLSLATHTCERDQRQAPRGPLERRGDRHLGMRFARRGSKVEGTGRRTAFGRAAGDAPADRSVRCPNCPAQVAAAPACGFRKTPEGVATGSGP